MAREVKLLKLIDGSEVVCTVLSEQDNVMKAEKVVMVNIIPDDGTANGAKAGFVSYMMLNPQADVEFNLNCIVAKSNLPDTMLKYYQQTTSTIQLI